MADNLRRRRQGVRFDDDDEDYDAVKQGSDDDDAVVIAAAPYADKAMTLAEDGVAVAAPVARRAYSVATARVVLPRATSISASAITYSMRSLSSDQMLSRVRAASSAGDKTPCILA